MITGLGIDDVDHISMSMKDLSVGNNNPTINMSRKVNIKYTYYLFFNSHYINISSLQQQSLKIHFLLLNLSP